MKTNRQICNLSYMYENFLNWKDHGYGGVPYTKWARESRCRNISVLATPTFILEDKIAHRRKQSCNSLKYPRWETMAESYALYCTSGFWTGLTRESPPASRWDAFQAVLGVIHLLLETTILNKLTHGITLTVHLDKSCSRTRCQPRLFPSGNISSLTPLLFSPVHIGQTILL